jgi:FtsP/CotA-like multicopper oxidase with cupredoxin domain
LNYTLEIDPATMVIISKVNGAQYNVSSSAKPPTLLKYHDNPSRTPDPGSNTFIVPDSAAGGQVRVVLLSTGAPGTHPFHLHGHTFYILAAGSGEFNSTIPLNLRNPPVRDSLVVPAAGYAVIQ